MTGLVICSCGHLCEEHRPGYGCRHVNAASRRFPAAERCRCTRFVASPAIGETEDFVGKQLSHLVVTQRLRLEPVEAEDLVAAIRIALWRASDQYDSRSHIPFGSFASTFTHNRAIDEMRSSRMFGRQGQHRLPELPPPPVVGDGEVSTVAEPADPILVEEIVVERVALAAVGWRWEDA